MCSIYFIVCSITAKKLLDFSRLEIGISQTFSDSTHSLQQDRMGEDSNYQPSDWYLSVLPLSHIRASNNNLSDFRGNLLAKQIWHKFRDQVLGIFVFSKGDRNVISLSTFSLPLQTTGKFTYKRVCSNLFASEKSNSLPS